MLKLVFAKASIGDVQEMGPFKEVRIGAETLLGDGRPLARHQEHCWFLGEERFFRVDASKPVVAHFEAPDGKRTDRMTFTRFSSADGIAYGDGLDFAHIDPREGTWYYRSRGTYWKDLVIVPE